MSVVNSKIIECVTQNHSPHNLNAMVDRRGIGRVIRNDLGAWILGFYNRNNGRNHTTTELEALHYGLTIASSHNFIPLEIGTDSLEIMILLDSLYPTYASTVSSSRSILRMLGNPVVRHSFRQENKIADILSRLGSKLTITSNPIILLSLSNVVKDVLKAVQDEVPSTKVAVRSNCNKLAHFGYYL